MVSRLFVTLIGDLNDDSGENPQSDLFYLMTITKLLELNCVFFSALNLLKHFDDISFLIWN